MSTPTRQPVHYLTAIERAYGPAVAKLATSLYRTHYRASFSTPGTAYAAARDHAVRIVERATRRAQKPAPERPRRCLSTHASHSRACFIADSLRRTRGLDTFVRMNTSGEGELWGVYVYRHTAALAA